MGIGPVQPLQQENRVGTEADTFGSEEYGSNLIRPFSYKLNWHSGLEIV